MSAMVLGRISREDLLRWREICAVVEVAQAPPMDMTTEQAVHAWLDYYAMTEDLHERYEIPDADRLDVTISVGSGLIRLGEE